MGPSSIDGCVLVTLLESTGEGGMPIEQARSAILLDQSAGRMTAPPKEGEVGVVVFTSISPNEIGFWLGSLRDRAVVANAPESMTTPGNVMLKSEKGAGVVMATDTAASLSLKDASVRAGTDSTAMAFASTSINVSRDGVEAVVAVRGGIGPTARLSLTAAMAAIETSGSFRLSAPQGSEFRTGATHFSGTTANPIPIGAEGEAVYSPMSEFTVKANKIALDAGSGALALSGGALVLKLGSGRLSSAGSGVPGTGPVDAFEVATVQGGITLMAGMGDVTVGSNNLDFIDVVELRNGSAISPVATHVTLSLTEALVQQEFAFGLTAAKLSLANLTATLQAFTNVDVTALLGALTLKGAMGVSISSMLTMALSALTLISISAPAGISMTTMALDLTKALSITAGPKVVVPTGVGPFCALPMCPITGAPHSGAVAIG